MSVSNSTLSEKIQATGLPALIEGNPNAIKYTETPRMTPDGKFTATGVYGSGESKFAVSVQTLPAGKDKSGRVLEVWLTKPPVPPEYGSIRVGVPEQTYYRVFPDREAVIEFTLPQANNAQEALVREPKVVMVDDEEKKTGLIVQAIQSGSLCLAESKRIALQSDQLLQDVNLQMELRSAQLRFKALAPKQE
jgi:hypothetical protein